MISMMNNTVKLQYTLFCTNGKSRPIACIITVRDIPYYNEHPEEFRKRAIEKICAQHSWTRADLKKMGYTQIKCRRYMKGLDI